jgi:hypothetical protein
MPASNRLAKLNPILFSVAGRITIGLESVLKGQRDEGYTGLE